MRSKNTFIDDGDELVGSLPTEKVCLTFGGIRVGTSTTSAGANPAGAAC